MESSQDQLEGGNPLIFMGSNRNTTSIVFHSDAVVLTNADADFIAIAGKGFVDTVINNFKNKMMQRGTVDTSNVHAWTKPYCFESFQHRNIRFVVTAV